MPERDLYRQLQRHLDKMPVGFPATESGVEIRILQRLFTPQDAHLALQLSAMPEPLAVIHKRVKREMSVEELGTALDSMADRGLIEKHGKRYGKSMFVVGIYERQVNRLTPELERDTLQYFDEAFAQTVHTKKTGQMRTVPVNQSIAVERGIAQYDDIAAFVRASKGPFAVMECVCQQGRDLVGSPCKQTDGREHCLTLGPAAKAMVESGVARYLTQNEMLAALELADRDGLVLQPQNTLNPMFVCCCCGCCCGVLTTAKKLEHPAEFFSASFYAEVNEARCEGCGTCLERCQMEAVTVADGTAIVDVLRCIGCGLCITTCPSEALHLTAKDRRKEPPKDTPALYAKIFKERFGPLGTAKAVGKNLLGLKV